METRARKLDVHKWKLRHARSETTGWHLWKLDVHIWKLGARGAQIFLARIHRCADFFRSETKVHRFLSASRLGQTEVHRLSSLRGKAKRRCTDFCLLQGAVQADVQRLCTDLSASRDCHGLDGPRKGAHPQYSKRKALDPGLAKQRYFGFFVKSRKKKDP